MKEDSIKIDFIKIKKISSDLLEQINAFFSHRENIAFLVFIISLAFLTQFIDIPNSVGKLLISIWLLLFLGYFLIFNLEKTEQFLLNKITWILLLCMLIIVKYQKDFGIENKDVFFMVGAIFAFWYGYKKYERDKEIENFNNLKIEIPESLEEKIFLWASKKRFYDKGYIQKYIYEYIEKYFLMSIQVHLKISSNDFTTEVLKYGDVGKYILDKVIDLLDPTTPKEIQDILDHFLPEEKEKREKEKEQKKEFKCVHKKTEEELAEDVFESLKNFKKNNY